LRVGAAQRQITLQSVGRQFAEFADAGADFLVILVPIHDHGFPLLFLAAGLPLPRSSGVKPLLQVSIHNGLALYSWCARYDIFSSSPWPASDQGQLQGGAALSFHGRKKLTLGKESFP